MSRLSCRSAADRTLPGRALLPGLLICLGFAQLATAAESPAPSPGLGAEQIVERHVAARGGLQAWRAVQTLTVSGTMDAGSSDSIERSTRMARGGVGATVKGRPAEARQNAQAAQQVQLPFTLEMKRPRKSRLEIQFAGQTAVQVYDGTNGWKLRPYLGRNEVETFTAEELKTSEGTTRDLDGPLIDYAAKGTRVQLEGVEPVDGHNAYKLTLTRKSGSTQNIWIDAQSFLDVKVEGIPRRMDGRMRKVWVYQRDFRSVQGVVMPYLCDTSVEGFPQVHRMTIQSVTVNRELSDARFSKPQVLVANSPAATKTPATAAPKATKK